jgi:hypothetical protein
MIEKTRDNEDFTRHIERTAARREGEGAGPMCSPPIANTAAYSLGTFGGPGPRLILFRLSLRAGLLLLPPPPVRGLGGAV